MVLVAGGLLALMLDFIRAVGREVQSTGEWFHHPDDVLNLMLRDLRETVKRLGDPRLWADSWDQ